MDYFREKYRNGALDAKKYEQIIEILDYLQEKNYCFVDVMGEGSFGCVLKVKYLTTNEEFAVKIVSEDFVFEGKTTLWPTVQHPKMLQLISCNYVYFL